jgi:hypothetical protein
MKTRGFSLTPSLVLKASINAKRSQLSFSAYIRKLVAADLQRADGTPQGSAKRAQNNGGSTS